MNGQVIVNTIKRTKDDIVWVLHISKHSDEDDIWYTCQSLNTNTISLRQEKDFKPLETRVDFDEHELNLKRQTLINVKKRAIRLEEELKEIDSK